MVVSKKPLTVDCHVDALWVHFKRKILGREAPPPMNIKAMKTGGLDSAFFALYLPDSTINSLPAEEVDLMIDWQVATFQTEYAHAKAPQFLSMENARLLGNSIQRLDELHKAGLKFITLTHNYNNGLGDSSTDKLYHRGLTDLGRHVVRACEERGIKIDISHSSDETAKMILDSTFDPVIASHSGCRKLNGHVRNLSDELIKEVADSKGVIHIPFAQKFISPHLPVDHIDHVIQVVGNVSHVGIGSDLDGAVMINDCPDASQWHNVTGESLYRKGYSMDDIHKICGENTLRLFT